jgi:hypothetical protein
VWIAPFRKHKLDLFDLVPCLRPAYDSGFSCEKNLAALAEIGFYPYNSILYWTLLAAETKGEGDHHQGRAEARRHGVQG